ncbi:MAG: hypothetical protein O8C55_06590 [Candidatus Methanoperedens sp.]|nr:hypothetical protein [Candidatus Methanoperedens sp.]
MKSTREKWFGKKYDFYLIGHEHLYVSRKPEAEERMTGFRESMKWWYAQPFFMEIVIRAYPRHPRDPCSIAFREFV